MVELEKRGVPAIAIGTKPFEMLARGRAASLGLENPRLALCSHPIAGIPDSEVAARVAEVEETVIDLLQGADSSFGG